MARTKAANRMNRAKYANIVTSVGLLIVLLIVIFSAPSLRDEGITGYSIFDSSGDQARDERCSDLYEKKSSFWNEIYTERDSWNSHLELWEACEHDLPECQGEYEKFKESYSKWRMMLSEGERLSDQFFRSCK